MNVLSKKRLTSQQRAAVNKAVKEQYYKINARNNEKLRDQIVFIYILATCITLEEKLKFGDKRRAEFIESVIATVNKVSNDLIGNKCFEDGVEVYDVDWNREILSRYAERYHIKFNEAMFDEEE